MQRIDKKFHVLDRNNISQERIKKEWGIIYDLMQASIVRKQRNYIIKKRKRPVGLLFVAFLFLFSLLALLRWYSFEQEWTIKKMNIPHNWSDSHN